MIIKFIKNHTVELPDGSAGLFMAGCEVELNNYEANKMIERGYAVRQVRE
jgi:hypothetical protein